MKCTVIFDGECDFCRSCVNWVKARTDITALPNQEIDAAEFGITREQCEKSVVVISDKTYFGAKAVAKLLSEAGLPITSKLLRTTGHIGELGYRYVASHRNGYLVSIMHWAVKKTL